MISASPSQQLGYFKQRFGSGSVAFWILIWNLDPDPGSSKFYILKHYLYRYLTKLQLTSLVGKSYTVIIKIIKNIINSRQC